MEKAASWIRLLEWTFEQQTIPRDMDEILEEMEARDYGPMEVKPPKRESKEYIPGLGGKNNKKPRRALQP